MTQPATPTTPRHRLQPRPHQEQAITAGTRELRHKGSRALITSACGTGKTLTAIRITDNLHARLVLTIFPTLDLLAQTALAWRADGRREPMAAFSSMDADAHDGLRTARVTGTGDVLTLAQMINESDQLTVFTTYASLNKIEEAQLKSNGRPFDLAIMDEAHRVSGLADKAWAIIHDAQRIRADRRLYLTATPRTWHSPDIQAPEAPRRPRTTAPARPAAAQSMTDTAVFGRRVHDYDLPTAIADGILADYRVLIPTITDDQLRTHLNHPTAHPDARRTTALHLAVAKAITEHQLTHVLVYFNEVDAANRFAKEFPHTLRRLPPQHRPPTIPHVASIHGEHTAEQRSDILAAFRQAPYAVLTNAKLLAEGIDIRRIDAVVFADATHSVVRCVQALGRALRKPADSDKVSSLVIPAYIRPGADPSDLLGTAYESVWAIASALRSHDHRITDRLPNRAHRLPKETSTLISTHWLFDFNTDPEAIARAMDMVAFDPRGPQSRARRQGLAALHAFHTKHGHLAVPGEYVDPHGFATGAFVQGQRDARHAGELDDNPQWIAELDALGMIWNTHDAAWQTNITTIRFYLADHGHLAIPSREPAGAFLTEQRSLAARGQLSEQRRTELDALDPQWQLPHGPDWTRKYGALRTYLRAGHDPKDIQADTVIGTVKAGSWLRRQHLNWHTLTSGQQELLTNLGLNPQLSTALPTKHTRRTFTQTLDLLLLFIRQEGRFPGAREWIMIDSERVMLGPWFAKTRTKQRNGEINQASAHLIQHHLGPNWHTDTTPQMPEEE
ncbi:helicase [Kitasatospora herbaricolor]|uniref:DEAD/DEAH box helicase n=1 Tax=Kitasatospora herbaricolor TaxID=68217 RepID=UPI00174B3B21|nr:DEAD/DEAH box helicase [Kitasatospora herbaricolor]MDQ0313312.1 superfamily II DNA or RNA helicase [Kitasatospora herbaricolor]GGV42124.1 helicase [Kitasatospora herbaricolor]